MTFLAITKEKRNRQLHAEWLTFWIANSFFTVFELALDVLLSGIPLYFEIKIALLVWLVMPRFRGSQKIYRQVIHPYLIKHETEIDERLTNFQKHGVNQLTGLKDAGMAKAMETVTGNQDFLNMGKNLMLQSLFATAAAPPARHRQETVEVVD
jgi:hypothetical protein